MTITALRLLAVSLLLTSACGDSAELGPPRDYQLNDGGTANGGTGNGGSGGDANPGGANPGGANPGGGAGGTDPGNLAQECAQICDDQDAGGCGVGRSLCRTICALLPSAPSTCLEKARAYQECQLQQSNACIVSPCATQLDAFEDECNVFQSN